MTVYRFTWKMNELAEITIRLTRDADETDVQMLHRARDEANTCLRRWGMFQTQVNQLLSRNPRITKRTRKQKPRQLGMMI